MKDFILHAKAQAVRIKTLMAYRNKNWRNLPIQENGEPMVEIPGELSHPFYAKEMKIWDDSRIFIRKTVLEMFLLARKKASCYGLNIVAYDGWRSIELQERLFWHYLKEFTVQRFCLQEAFSMAKTPTEIKEIFLSLSLDMQVIMKEANRAYVSWPSSNHHSPSPHATGGSLDVWLYSSDNQPVNLGVTFDWMEENAGAFYHLKLNRKKFPGNSRMVCCHRNILLDCMVSAGFSCYGPEIWHFNYGNQMDSLVSGKIACYSYVEPRNA